MLNETLAGIPVGRLMAPAPVTVPASGTIARFLADAPFGRYRHAAFPILAPDGTPVGLVTVARINRVPVYDRSHIPVSAVMCPLSDLTTAYAQSAGTDLLPLLESHAEQGEVLGVWPREPIEKYPPQLATWHHRGYRQANRGTTSFGPSRLRARSWAGAARPCGARRCDRGRGCRRNGRLGHLRQQMAAGRPAVASKPHIGSNQFCREGISALYRSRAKEHSQSTEYAPGPRSGDTAIRGR
ncbi:hypothetical protein H9Y04_15175 [Streptomyces sp. TRM66268-LWL]|uniref:CBS domain-containing protein n=1 Tax=Streptomyces polyasparticus TaxID=2767826 RepID=A0ABR7SEH3_9ACTN|nr:hypothetical protein [Streptomyces polyasparticus]MBC9713911.1 hypothetical protein [Streptomyces polyasparticus]